MKKLIITEKDSTIRLATEKPLGFEEVLNLSMSAILSMANTVTNNVPENHRSQVKEYLFDQINMAASSLLAQFAPEIDLRSDIQAEAILKLEDQILSERAAAMILGD